MSTCIIDLTVQPLDKNWKMDTLSMENISAKSSRKKKKRRKSSKAVVKDEGQSLDPNNIDTRFTNNITEENVIMKKLQIEDEVQSEGQTKMDTGPTENITEEAVPGKRKKKRKRNVMAEIEAEVQSEMDAINLAEGNLITKKPKIKDEVQKSGHTKMDTGSTEYHAEGNVNIGNSKIQEESQSMYQNNLDNRQAKSVIIGIVAGKMKKKRKRKKAKPVDEVQKEMDARSTDNLDEENVTFEKPKVIDELQSLCPTQMNKGSTENLADGKVITVTKTVDEAQSMDQNTMVTLQLEENLAQENVAGKRRKKLHKKKGKVNDEVHSEMDSRSTENLATLDTPEVKDAVQSVVQTQMDTGSTDNVAEENVTIENTKVQDEIQSIDQAKVNMPTQGLSEGNVVVKRKRKRKRTKAKVKDEFSDRMDAELTENLAEVDVNIRIPETRDELPSMGQKVMDAGSTENLSKGTLTSENPKNKDECQSMDTGPAKDFTNARKSKRKRRRTRKAKIVSEFPSVSRGGTILNVHLSEGHPNFLAGLSQVSNEIILDEGIDPAEGRSAISICNACTVKDVEVLCLKMAPIVSVRRKLLVLDINGLLADVVFPAPKHCKGDIKFYGRAVFRRPFCGDFLKFCFQNFYVGIWSSRSKKIIEKVVSYLLGDQMDKLLFCWDMTHTTKTGFNTLENRHKPLVCKELRKIWEYDDPRWPWEKGDYNESNTLLLDDSPYKALLNPLHTAIFPHPYQYSDKNDNSLGPGGDLRVYLEGLEACENVQKYVEQHPFGQNPISEQDLSWEFYDKVLKQISKDKTSHSFSLIS